MSKAQPKRIRLGLTHVVWEFLLLTGEHLALLTFIMGSSCRLHDPDGLLHRVVSFVLLNSPFGMHS